MGQCCTSDGDVPAHARKPNTQSTGEARQEGLIESVSRTQTESNLEGGLDLAVIDDIPDMDDDDDTGEDTKYSETAPIKPKPSRPPVTGSLTAEQMDQMVDFVKRLSAQDLSQLWPDPSDKKVGNTGQFRRVMIALVNRFANSIDPIDAEAMKLIGTGSGVSVWAESMEKRFIDALENGYDEYALTENVRLPRYVFEGRFKQYIEFPTFALYRQLNEEEKVIESDVREESEEKTEAVEEEPERPAYDPMAAMSIAPIVKETAANTGGVDRDICGLLTSILAEQSSKKGADFFKELLKYTAVRRAAIASKYVSKEGLNLIEHLKKTISGDALALAQELVRSPAENDAHWIKEALTKSPNDTHVLNEILCTRTNEQIRNIIVAYNKQGGGELIRDISDGTQKMKHKYASLLAAVLSEQRIEEPWFQVDQDLVKTDVEALEKGFGDKKDIMLVQTLVGVIGNRSWSHIDRVARVYNRKSEAFNLSEEINRRFGNTEFGEAVLTTLQMSSNRINYFAERLLESMKGIGTDNEKLIRLVVSRSEIDMAAIVGSFNRRWGEGQTLYQWYKSEKDLKSGPYGDAISALCGLPSPLVSSGTQAEADDSKEAPKTWILDLVKRDYPMWDDYVAAAPSIRAMKDFDATTMAESIFAAGQLKNKKGKRDFKEKIITDLTTITNSQRQELATVFAKMSMNTKKDLLGNVISEMLGKKGKTLSVLQALLKSSAAYDAHLLKVATGKGNMGELFALLCSRSNSQLKALRDVYERDLGGDLSASLTKFTSGKKTLRNTVVKHLLEGDRPESVVVDVQSVKDDIRILQNATQNKAKDEKEKFATLMMTRSWAHIYKLDQMFATGFFCKKTFLEHMKDVMGSKLTYGACKVVYDMATNRYGYFAQKLQESMKGIGSDEELLVSTLVSRSELDLAEVVDTFSLDPIYGGGKTLHQYIKDDTAGSFGNLLLRICSLGSGDFISYESDEDSLAPFAGGIINAVSMPPPQHAPMKSSFGKAIGASSMTSGRQAGAGEEIDVKAMGEFMTRKLNQKTVEKLWKHVDKDGSGSIENEEVLNLLVFTASLYKAFLSKARGEAAPQVDKKALKASLAPLSDWINNSKMSAPMTKEEFRNVMGKWLVEYAEIHS